MHDDELTASRREFEERLDYLRQNLHRKTGLRPRRTGWWLLALAGAVGMALSARTRSRRQIGD